MKIKTKKKYKVIIELTESEIKELDRQRKSKDNEVMYEEMYESLAIIEFKEKVLNEILKGANLDD